MKLKFSKILKSFVPESKTERENQREINFFRNTNGRYFRDKLIEHKERKRN